MAISTDDQTKLLKVVVGLFNAAPGGTYLPDLESYIENGGTQQNLARELAATTLFADSLGTATTSAEKAAVLAGNFGLTADNVPGSAATQAIDFFDAGIDAGTNIGDLVYEAVMFLADNPPAEFAEIAQLLDNKATVAADYSATKQSSDLSVLQAVFSAAVPAITGTAPITQADADAIVAAAPGDSIVVPGSFTLTAAAPSVTEGAGLTYTVTASEPVAADTAVEFTVIPGGDGPDQGTALTNANDFVQGSLNPTSVIIPAGQTTATFSVTAANDGLTESVESYKVQAVVGGETLDTTTSLLDGQGVKTFTLTSATDNISGTSGNDTIIGDWSSTPSTVQASDQINGGAGIDTLKLFGAPGTLPATLSGIEVVNLVNPGDLSGAAIQTAINGIPSGVTKLTVEQATATGSATLDTTALSGLTLDLATLNGGDVGDSITWDANATDTAQTLELSGYNGAASATSPQALTITGAATTTLNINTDTGANAIKKLTGPATTTAVNINAATNLNISEGLVAAAVAAVNVIGAGQVTIGAGSDLAATVTVDGSANTGGLLFTDETGGSVLTFKGGSGDDTVAFAAGMLTAADILTGGEGTDTLTVNDTGLTTAGSLAAVNAATGFETLGLGTTGTTLDMSLLTNGIQNVKVGPGDITATTTNSLNASNYTIDNTTGNTGTVTIGNKVGQVDTAIKIDNTTATTAQTIANVTINGALNVALESTGTGAGTSSNVITTFANMDNTVLTITGSEDLTITNPLAGTGTGSTVDASGFTGKLSLIGSGQADILTGGSAADTLNGGAGNDTINGGAGDDLITVSDPTQGDILTGGAGADEFIFSGVTPAAMAATSNGTSDIVNITDFVAGTDKIGLFDTGGPFTSVTLATQTIATAADLTAVWAGITAIGASTAGGAAAASLITVTAGAAAGTYLYVNDATPAVDNSLDMLVDITGVTGTLATTDFVFA